MANMKNNNKTSLPKILIIDDQFGRSLLGPKFCQSVKEEILNGYIADRQNLCFNYGLVDISNNKYGGKVSNPIAEVVFCPAQRWNSDTKSIENDETFAMESVKSGWPFNDKSRWSLILLDLRFVCGPLNVFGDPQEGSLFGIEVLLPLLREQFGEDLPIVVLSSTSKDENNATVRKLGAIDFIQRIPGAGDPPDKARKTLSNVLFNHGLIPDYSGLIIGESLPVLKMLRQARRGAASARNIMLLGETGTGKGLLAHYIHKISSRSDGPFEVFHAAHRPAELQADELFGHRKGAFTGAHEDTPGIWERADGGTLFIDEVADIDIKVQQTLMQPIEERKVRRMGAVSGRSSEPKSIDVQVVLATNRDINLATSTGELKGDFLNRINAFTIEIPPLRNRRNDIPVLADHLAAIIMPGWNGKFLSDAMEALLAQEWRDGNVRELRNVIERAITNNPDQDITAADVTMTKAMHVTSVSDNQEEANIYPHIGIESIIRKDIRKLSLEEIEKIRRDLSGGFPEFLAEIFKMALDLTQSNGKLNPTAAVRFLLGNDKMTTVQAKQFIKRLLMLDTQNKSIYKAINKIGIAGQHKMLDRIMRECERPRRRLS